MPKIMQKALKAVLVGSMVGASLFFGRQEVFSQELAQSKNSVSQQQANTNTFARMSIEEAKGRLKKAFENYTPTTYGWERDTSAFSDFLEAEKFKRAFDTYPEVFVRVVEAYVQWNGRSLQECMETLAESGMADVLGRNPSLLGRLVEDMSPSLHTIVYFLPLPRISSLFLAYPDQMLDVVKASQGDASEYERKKPWNYLAHCRVSNAFRILCQPEMAEAFMENPASFVEFAEIVGEFTNSALRMFENPFTRGLFLENQGLFKEIIRNIRRDKESFYYGESVWSLGDSTVAKMIVEYPDRFLDLSSAFGGESFLAFNLVAHQPQIHKFFILHRARAVKALKDFFAAAYPNGEDACAILEDADVARQFAKSPKIFIEFAQATRGGHGWNTFTGLSNPILLDYFVRNHKKAIWAYVKIRRELGESADDALGWLGEDKVAAKFVRNPDLFVREVLKNRENINLYMRTIAGY